MQNNLLDELIADYRGIVAALGYYRADWFLQFMGLESYPDYRHSGRLQNYLGQPPLSDRAFEILQALVVAAAKNLEDFDRQYADQLKLARNQSSMLIALTYLTLEELASDKAFELLQTVFQRLQNYLSPAEKSPQVPESTHKSPHHPIGFSITGIKP